MSDLILLSSNLSTAVTSMVIANCFPGKSFSELLGVKNNSGKTLSNTYIDFWPGIKNGQPSIVQGSPVKSVKIIRQNSNEIFQYETFTQEELIKRTTREKFFLKSGGVYTRYLDTDETPLLDASTSEGIILSDFLYYAIYFDLKTAGSYTGLTFQKWNGSAWDSLPSGNSDGTSSLSSSGRLVLGAVTESNFQKTYIEDSEGNIHYGYAIKWTATGVTTPAVANIGGLYWEWVYDFDKAGLFSPSENLTMYEKTTTPSFVQISNPTTLYANLGRAVYNSAPFAASDSVLAATYASKKPLIYTQTADAASMIFNLEFTSANTVSVNGGTAITVLTDGTTKYTNIIPGCEVVFNTVITTGDEVNIYISDGLRYLFLAADSSGTPGTYYNDRINLGSIADLSVKGFWVKHLPPNDTTADDNTRCEKIYMYGA